MRFILSTYKKKSATDLLGDNSYSAFAVSSIRGNSACFSTSSAFAPESGGINPVTSHRASLFGEKKAVQGWLKDVPRLQGKTPAEFEAEKKLAEKRAADAIKNAKILESRNNSSKMNSPKPDPGQLDGAGDDEIPITDAAELPHKPLISDEDMLNPYINPIAGYWLRTDAPGNIGLTDDNLKPLDPFDHTLPRFETDPAMPFAPWLVANLPRFRTERSTRTVRIPRRFVAAVGMLYPDATFLIAQHPASQNQTHRMTGSQIAKMMAVTFPELMTPGRPGYITRPPAADLNHGGHIRDATVNYHPSATASGPGNNGLDNRHEPTYIMTLRHRDWPSGAVATVPDTPAIRTLFDTVKSAFDVMPNGAEVWFYVGHPPQQKTALPHAGSVRPVTITVKTVSIFRGYEGVQGPQHDRVVNDWAVMNKNAAGGQPWGMMPREDEVGKMELVFHGEAWVMPDRWPKMTKREREGKKGEGERRRKRVRVKNEPEDEEGDEMDVEE